MFKKGEIIKTIVYILFLLFWVLTILIFATTGIAKTIVVILWFVTMIVETIFTVIYFFKTSERKQKSKYDSWGREN